MRLWFPGLLVVIACTARDAPPAADAADQPDSAIWTEASAWRLSREPLRVIAGSAENVEEAPLDPVAAFRLTDGRYAVADGDQNGWDGLLIYDASGKYVGRWGRSGGGPGEFGQLLGWAGVYRGDSVAAYDWRDRALEIFSPDGTFARALKLPPQNVPGWGAGAHSASDFLVGAFADGNVLRFERSMLELKNGTGPVWYEPELSLYDPNGQRLRSMGRYRIWPSWWDGNEPLQYIFGANALTAVGRNRWYHGRAEGFSIDVFAPDGTRITTLRKPYEHEPVTDSDREAFITWYVDRARSGREGGATIAERVERRLRERSRFAETKPAYSNLIEDADGNLWVEHYRWPMPDAVGPDPKATRWSVFAREGRWLGEVQMPAAFLVSSITHDQVIGFSQDDFDVQHVQVYGLIKPRTR